MKAHGAEAQQTFTTATLMCVVWLAALTMLVQQARFIDFPGARAPLISAQSLAFLAPYSKAKPAME